MMKLSPQLQAMVDTLHHYYPAELIAAVLEDAEHKALWHGRRHTITIADWDDVLDDQPIDGSGYRIVTSPYVNALAMLMAPRIHEEDE